MAKKTEKPKIVLERTYTIPLRKEFLKAPKYKRAKKAVTAVRKFLSRHMKSDSIKLGKNLNSLIWAKGIRNPPHHITVSTVREETGIVRAELVGKPIYEEPKEEKKKPAAKSEAEKKSPAAKDEGRGAGQTEGKAAEKEPKPDKEEKAQKPKDKTEAIPQKNVQPDTKAGAPDEKKAESEKLQEPKSPKKKPKPIQKKPVHKKAAVEKQ